MALRPATDEELVVLLAEMTRYDARLLGALVAFVLSAWRRLSPVALRDAMRRSTAPQATCVVAEFAKTAEPDRELGHWVTHVTAGWPRAHPAAHFFVDDVRPGERTAARRMGRSLAPYSRWGYVAVERPTVDPHRKRAIGRYDPRTRRMALDALLREDPAGVTLASYLDAVDRSVSRQQALADLRVAGLVPDRRGRGARWTRKRPRR